jgi:exopolysaccharide biosynthesis polyprenyl glycosylphosphotransferase
MNRRKRDDVNLAILAIIIDAALTFLVFFLLDSLCEQRLPVVFDGANNACFPGWSYWVVPIFWMISFLFSSAYDPKRTYKIVDEFQTVFMSIALGFLLFIGFLFVFGEQISRRMFFYFVVLDLVILLGWRLLFRFYVRTTKIVDNEKTILVVGAGSAGQLIVEMIMSKGDQDLHVVGYLDDDSQENVKHPPVIGKLKDIREKVIEFKVDEVIFSLPIGQYEQAIQLILKIDDIPVRVRVIPDYFNMTYHRTKVENFYGIPLIGLRDPYLNEVQLLFKRIFDTTLSLACLLLLWPFFLIIAIFIQIDSKGPVIFKHERVGENGRIFLMYKFRTMVQGASKMEAAELPAQKVPNDPRVTRIGRFLRRTSLDELPQLINILRGDMSFVGPRPEMPWRVAQYEPWQRARFSVPQGLTGWWQVNGRANKPMHLHTQDDLYYIENYSIWLDLVILIKTPLVVLRGKGAF